MKKIWWAINVFWIVLFGGLATFIYLREVDGAGAVQTPELRWLSLALLGVVFILVAIIQLIFLFFLKKPKS
ncbi:heme/copper-type cytochrome/quinol oxidase subunit 2 [Solibacillus kalamii]|uniref:NADH:ubiquinone oxidoreductase n=2 Tax=Solibacillus TaxID=648800 RepID=K1KVF3_9BACL|nr:MULTISPECIES: DUF3923 family protein [Solibacillus]AMO85869.1 NADH:ubiquinone oxidoreductase [Solibacillus silvestris]EKB46531.1 hypothetical protein B857_00741 [Solibacillus isronensis B3W22]MBM7664074.1 heme/copper-type cytochrome/quinol oxidase subunit 2 [Solibacillus kalamii]OUZ40152.1 NADH:ubiquinone oxidoreductase [Solibacillus kalamii]